MKNKYLPRTLLFALSFFIFFGVAYYYTEARLPDRETPIRLYANQSRDDLTLTLVKAIDKAEKSILVIVYTLTDHTIINRLKQKAEEGLDVTVIVDGEASPRVAKQLGPKIHTFVRNDSGLMHQKIIVIDKKQVWVGSANMTRHSLRIHGNLVSGLESPELAEYVLSEAANTSKGAEVAQGHRAFTIGGQNVELWFLPSGQEPVTKLVHLIDSAKKSVKIAMFTWTRKDLAEATIRAKLRGLQVEVAMDKNSALGSSKYIANMFLEGQLPTYINQNDGLLHYKFMWIDSNILVNGSANWTKAAFTQNRDCFMIIYNLTDSQKKLMNNLWKVIIAESAPLTKVI